MRMPVVEWERSGLTDAGLRATHEALGEELERLRHAATTLYEDDLASINLPLDKAHLRQSLALAAKHARATLLVVIGIFRFG